MKDLVHQQPYKEILWSLSLEKYFSLRSSFSYWFFYDLILSLWLPLWQSSCLITLEIQSLVSNLILLSSKSRLTKPWFHTVFIEKFSNFLTISQFFDRSSNHSLLLFVHWIKPKTKCSKWTINNHWGKFAFNDMYAQKHIYWNPL